MKQTFCAHYLFLSVLSLLFLQCTAPENKSSPDSPVISLKTDRFDNRFDRWAGDSVYAEVLAEGFAWSEGPVWLDTEKKLLFSDVPANTIHSWSDSGGLAVYLTPSGYTGETERTGEMGSNGLLLDNEGKLLLCQHGDRRVARMLAPLDDPAAQFETLAGSFDNRKLNSPNDLVVAKDGSIYFTDPPYGLVENVNDPAKELDFQGVYKITPDGRVILLTDTITRPNGIELSNDEMTLYVGNSDRERPYWMSYRINGDSLSDGQIFVDPREYFDGASGSDGMVVASDGTIISTGYGGIWFITPAGDVLGRIQIPQAVANCTLDSQEKYLYVTAHHQLLRIRLPEQ